MPPESQGTVASSSVPQAELVSCIIIFLNEEKYLAQAIESVIAQTYPNWELLLVDDGSTDGSETIARSFCARFPAKVRYLTHKDRSNRGMSASRNLGLREARGTYVAFLDGDDRWVQGKVERQTALFRAHPNAIMVCGATCYWHSWQKHSPRPDQTVLVGEHAEGDERAYSLQQDHLFPAGVLIRRLYPLGKGTTPSSSGNMIRLDAALAVGGYEEAFPGLFEDQVFRAKLYLHGAIFVSHETFDFYRQHEESCYHVAKSTGASSDARRQFLRWLRGYLHEFGCRDPRVWLQLQWRSLPYDAPNLYLNATKVGRRIQGLLRKVRSKNAS